MTKHVYIYIPFSLDWNLALVAIAEGACICTEDEEHTMTPCYERARGRGGRLQVFRRIAHAAAHNQYFQPWSACVHRRRSTSASKTEQSATSSLSRVSFRSPEQLTIHCTYHDDGASVMHLNTKFVRRACTGELEFIS